MEMEQFRGAMEGRTVLLSGGGGGIGFEAVRAFVWMGARVAVAELVPERIASAKAALREEFPDLADRVTFYRTDLSNPKELEAMLEEVGREFGCPDVVFNNAAAVRLGAVEEVGIDGWDSGYAVNLRAPLALAAAFLPAMKRRGSGAVIFVSSSGAAPGMGAYEVFKTAQVELANTLAMELEGSGVSAYTIGPGLVRTETAAAAIAVVAENMGMTTEEFYQMNESHILDAESAGWGFALSALDPQRYHGQEIGSIQVLIDYGAAQAGETPLRSASIDLRAAKEALSKIRRTFGEQYAGWRAMNLFERQWVLRDFKKSMEVSAEQADALLGQLEGAGASELVANRRFFERLHGYWTHQLQLLRGFERNPAKLEENSRIIQGWMDDIDWLVGCLSDGAWVSDD